MQHSQKLALNGVVSVARVIINGVVTLIATRIALKALGADDYGIFNLIAGVITLLSFINGALMASAQRFFSIALGQKNNSLLNEYFNTSVSIHTVIGIGISLFFYSVEFWLFSGFLNISGEKINVAIQVYNLMIISSFITITGVPYSALINAYEDMTLLAFSSVAANVVKLLAAIVLLYINSHLLLIYTIITVVGILIKLLIEYLWCHFKYETSTLHFKMFFKNKHYNKMIGFIGWNTFGTAGVLVRNQGIAVLLNIVFGTVINAVYGIANQVNSLVLSFSSTITTIFTPTIIQAKGEGNNERMLRMSVLSSKLSFFISSLISLPILGFTSEILCLWLGDYPDKTTIFCKYIIISFLISQLFPGINRAILAEGKIKWYEIFTFICYVAIIPISMLLFKYGFSAESAMVLMVLSHIALLFLTIKYAHKFCGLSEKDFIIYSVIVPSTVFVISQFLMTCGKLFFDSLEAQIFVLVVIFVIYIFTYWLFVLDNNEKNIFRQLIKTIIK